MGREAAPAGMGPARWETAGHLGSAEAASRAVTPADVAEAGLPAEAVKARVAHT